MTSLPAADIRRAVRLALEEDLGQGDVTTSALFPQRTPGRAAIMAQQDLVVAGLAAAVQTFLAVDISLIVTPLCKEGDLLTSHQSLMRIEGDGRSILMAERVALNFLQHLSGIATLTKKFCDAVRDYPVAILDTRKTIPGIRVLEKWAVTLGGGQNHRRSLGDGILIKDNHLALLKARKKGIREACRQARKRASDEVSIIVEVETLADVRQAVAGKADVILLDNMTPQMARQAVSIIKERALVEVSGGITLNNVKEMAAAGPDFISVGALTHSAPAAALSLELEPLSRASRRRK
jgi:nicotinate-nucleotide pyrophosphorylase (carboxylating)